jgi:Tfp pilus assembly protein PilF
MLLGWLNAGGATEVGTALADQFAPRLAEGKIESIVHEILRRIEAQAHTLRLNLYRRAKLVKALKSGLLEREVEPRVAEELSRALLLQLSLGADDVKDGNDPLAEENTELAGLNAQELLARAQGYLKEGAHEATIACYQAFLELDPKHATVLSNVGIALCKLGRYEEAEAYFRRTVALKPSYSEARNNLGAVLRWRGRLGEAESHLRRAIKLNPRQVDARWNLGMTLVTLGRLSDAQAQFAKVLELMPRHANALYGVGLVAQLEGHFDEAAAAFTRALEVNPSMSNACAGLAGLRRMSHAEHDWLVQAERIAASGIHRHEEAELRFAIGKYHDDVGEFARAFVSYRRANELMKSIAKPYDRAARTGFVDDTIQMHTRERLSGGSEAGSDCEQPVFIVGMPRSGSSLIEQIIASHPQALGAGELTFWSETAQARSRELRQGLLTGAMREELATSYLRVLRSRGADPARIVDKALLNCDYLGLIHATLPRARILYVLRDPIDTCLSCYFQHLPMPLNFTLDLEDLAHYYIEQRRLMAHWRTVLPRDSILEIPYEALVADQEGWTRKILGFIGLEWDERCLRPHEAQRPVMTASYWQVRQQLYAYSVQRWKNYRKFIGPLKALQPASA